LGELQQRQHQCERGSSYCAGREELLSQGICSVDLRGAKKSNVNTNKNNTKTKKSNVKTKKNNTKTTKTKVNTKKNNAKTTKNLSKESIIGLPFRGKF